MPWQEKQLLETRTRFVLAVVAGHESFAGLCRQFGFSRKTGYKWWRRYQTGGLLRLTDQPRRPRRWPGAFATRWPERLRQLRQRHPHWGPKKLRARLRQTWPQSRRWPAVSTLARWLHRWRLTAPRLCRARRGPRLPAQRLTVAHAPNEVWTVDFKGWFRTGDGTRVEPLAVRDLYSRRVLDIRLLPDQSDAQARRAMTRLFQRFGLPQVIRVDNGAPFGGSGPLGLTRLSVWWLRLGIQVEFTRRAHPEDNGGHEQMHRVFKQEATRPPAPTVRGQQHRSTRWVNYYNQRRPHEALGQRVPGSHYRPSARPYPRPLPSLTYPAGWAIRRVVAHGDIKWQGRFRLVGRAFVGQTVGLQPQRGGGQKVYLGSQLIGYLLPTDRAGMRPAFRPKSRPQKIKNV